MRFEFLSYPMRPGDPVYGGGAGLKVAPTREMSRGDTCNSSEWILANHIGTHVDAPRHFIEGARTIDEFTASELVHERIQVLEIPLFSGRLLLAGDFKPDAADAEATLLLLRTGFGGRRALAEYVFDGPGFGPESARTLLQLWPRVRAIGMDFISVNRFTEKEAGREAHRILLARPGMLLIEDMDLSMVSESEVPMQVTISPIRIQGADGAPATVIAAFRS